MADKTAKASDASLDQAVERIRELNERIVSEGRVLGIRFLDSYEESLRTLLDLQQRLADSTGQEWLTDIAKAQTDLLRNLGEAYVNGAREFLSKT